MTDKKDIEGITAIVKEGLQEDVGKKTIRLNSYLMKDLSIEEEDTVEIEGKDKAIAIVKRAIPSEDIDEIAVRIDGSIRHNLGITIGDSVTIRKYDCPIATNMTIAPRENIRFSGDPSFYFKQRLVGKPFVKGEKFILEIMGNPLHFVVTKTSPKGYVTLDNKTELTISDEPATVEEAEDRIPEVTYEDIGGLREEIDQIREMVELPMKHPEIFERVGIGAPKGVLLTGPPGTGKTLLAKAVASETESNFYAINGPEIMSKFYGESEKQLREIFDKAEENSPSIVFIDEIDSIAPNRSETTGEQERRIVSQILTLMDGLKGRGQVVVIAATNRVDSLDPALRRPGRFDREIPINAPDGKGRLEILKIHTRGMPLDKDVDLEKLAEITIGYTGADLEVLCKEAALRSLKNWIPDLQQTQERVPANVLEKISIKMDHFVSAFRKVEPSAMREVLIKKPTTKYDDIGGLKEVKIKLKEMIEWPMTKADMFTKAGITPPKGIVLSGPPGTGKTLLAKAVANESNANFISIKGPELISKWVGESEKHVREIFKKARQVAPSIIFFDEFDAIAGVRNNGNTSGEERVVNQLLTELDGVEELSGVTIIAATNRADLIDPALLRPGRFDQIIEIGLPDKETRAEIFKVHMKNMPVHGKFSEILVDRTENLSGAEIANICKEAGMNGMRRAIDKDSDEVMITESDFMQAIDSTKEKLQVTNKQNVSYIA